MIDSYEINLGSHKAIIDLEDKDLVLKYKWKLTKTKSNILICITYFLEPETKKKKNIWLHQIVKPQSSKMLRAFFKDGNRLNCKKENIEYIPISTFSHIYSKKTILNESREHFRGVSKVFKSRIKFNKVIHYLGTFDNPTDAAKAYNQKAIELYGKKAKINPI